MKRKSLRELRRSSYHRVVVSLARQRDPLTPVTEDMEDLALRTAEEAFRAERECVIARLERVMGPLPDNVLKAVRSGS